VDQVPEWGYLAMKLYAKHLAYQAIAHPEAYNMYRAFEAEIAKLQKYVNPRTAPQLALVEGIYDEEDGVTPPRS
jgi:hypothetical protein